SPASPEQTTTGTGSSDMIFLRKVRPSIRGISRSSRITSGRACFILPIAINGSAADETVIPGGAESSADVTWRTTAESSTTRTCNCFRLCALRSELLLLFVITLHPRLLCLRRDREIDCRDGAAHAVGDSVEAFRVTQQEIPARRQMAQKLIHRPAPGLGVEIDQDVAAEDQIEGAGRRIRFVVEVESLELTTDLTSAPAFIFPSCERVPLSIKRLRKLAGIPFDLSIDQVAPRATLSAFVERSVARISIFQPWSAGKRESRLIAIEKGSSPVEQPALHALMCFGLAPEAASASHRG